MGAARVAVVRDAATLHGPIGDLVTLLPVHGPARGVTTTGLLYPLDAEDLPAGTTRGVSNELVHDPATVTVADGVLVAIQPGQLGTHTGTHSHDRGDPPMTRSRPLAALVALGLALAACGDTTDDTIDESAASRLRCSDDRASSPRTPSACSPTTRSC